MDTTREGDDESGVRTSCPEECPVMPVVLITDSSTQSIRARQEEANRAFQRGMLAIAAQDLTRAADAFTASLHLAMEVADQVGQGRALQGLGMIADHRLDFVEALCCYQSSRDCYQAANHHTGQMLIANLIGIASIHLHRIAEAQSAFQLSLAFATTTNAAIWQAKARFWLEKIAQAPPDPMAAEAFWQTALQWALHAASTNAWQATDP